MGKIITGVINFLPGVAGKLIPAGYMTKIAGVGMILAGVGGYLGLLSGADMAMSAEAATGLVFTGLAAFGIRRALDE